MTRMNRRRAAWLGATIVVAAASLLLITRGVVIAHEDRLVGDRYSLNVGFYIEPAQVGEENFVELAVTDVTEDGRAVDGLEETLRLEVTAGDDTRELPLTAKVDSPGGYRGAMGPKVPGMYTARFFGMVEEVSVDTSFQIGPVEGTTVPNQLSSRTTIIGVVVVIAVAGLAFYGWRSVHAGAGEADGGEGNAI